LFFRHYRLIEIGSTSWTDLGDSSGRICKLGMGIFYHKVGSPVFVTIFGARQGRLLGIKSLRARPSRISPFFHRGPPKLG